MCLYSFILSFFLLLSAHKDGIDGEYINERATGIKQKQNNNKKK